MSNNLHAIIAVVAVLACSTLYAGKKNLTQTPKTSTPRKRPLPNLTVRIPPNNALEALKQPIFIQAAHSAQTTQSAEESLVQAQYNALTEASPVTTQQSLQNKQCCLGIWSWCIWFCSCCKQSNSDTPEVAVGLAQAVIPRTPMPPKYSNLTEPRLHTKEVRVFFDGIQL